MFLWLFPTGYGKSLVYGCLPLVFDIAMKCNKPSSIVVVVCPLKALMKDQAESFTNLGLTASFIGDKSISSESILSGDIQLLFISPESLGKGGYA